ncbi:hypothetical protein [Pararhodospirillum oryzae]|uniref:Uncharacterized protein n=1 Tax=Pararhodospirillum oryzae TaxID=478448 RepID=A0A512H9Y9_9PROT|nr:hypothetical protein [Pararhodospirillum oryzae]GEO82271.1 hypothetical protein ROR02_24020 [Pararhodospirillum oryzae]
MTRPAGTYVHDDATAPPRPGADVAPVPPEAVPPEAAPPEAAPPEGRRRRGGGDLSPTEG